MKQPPKILCTVFLVTVIGGCASTFEANYDHDSNQDFSGYQTFAWISKNPMKVGQATTVPNPLLEPRIMAALESELVAKGYRKVSAPAAADFVLSFTIGSRDKIRADSYPKRTNQR